MNKIAVFFAEGYEEIEALTVVDLCRRAKIIVDMISVSGTDTVKGAHGILVSMDKKLSEINFSEYDMLVLPGGMPGTKNLEACEFLMKELDVFYQSGKYVAAICAAPSIFGHRGYLKGKAACCYPGFEEELTGAFVSQNQVEVAENVMTSRGLGTAIPFALAIVEHFCEKAAADELAKGVIYR